MKLEKKFDVNCSESTYTVGKEHTTAELALAMITVINSHWGEGWESGKKTGHPQYKTTAKWLKAHKEYNDGIYFTWSCNYDTWIYNDGKELKVNTCNNDPWDELEIDIRYNNPNPEDYFEIPDDEIFLDLSDMIQKTRAAIVKKIDDEFKEISK